MNLTRRIAQLEKRQPLVDQAERQRMIASIQEWLNELEMKAPADREAQLYLEAIQNMLNGP